MGRRHEFADMMALRPWLEHGKSWVSIKDKGTVPYKGTAVFNKQEWQQVDKELVQGFNLGNGPIGFLSSIDCPNGRSGGLVCRLTEPSITQYQYEEQTEGGNTYKLQTLPLPLIHWDFPIASEMEKKQILISKMGYFGFNAKCGGWRMGEKLLDVLLNGSTPEDKPDLCAHGLRTHPNRFTATAIGPAVLALNSHNFFGPFVTLTKDPKKFWYDQDPYGPQLQDWISKATHLRCPGLNDNEAIILQTTQDVLRFVVAVPPTVVQWTPEGKLKAVMVYVPQLRTDSRDELGVAHLLLG